ncbi:MAG: hypothetical protein JKY37_19100 [Nannocystaceae bacterium]|nr:hypothetical protein [Nannocystaceae bacterium]
MLIVRRGMVLIAGLSLAGCTADENPASQDSTGDTAASSTGDSGTDPDSSSGPPLGDSGSDSTTGGSSEDGVDSSDSGSGSTGDSLVDEGCPECLVLATGLQSGRGIAVNDTHVFWSDEGAGTIHRIAKGGGGGMIIVRDAGTPYELALDDQHLYWTSNADDGAVLRVPVGGGETELVASAINPRTVDVAGGSVYWGGYDGVSGELYRAPVDPLGPAENIGSFLGGGISDLVATETNVFASTHTELDDVAFIVPPPNGPPVGSVFMLDPDNIDPEQMPLVTGMAQPWGLALSGDTLVWANGDGVAMHAPNSIQSAEIGSAAAVQLAGDQAAPWGIAADAEFVYWTDSNTVNAVRIAGGTPEVLATQQNAARYITVDDAFVYWVTADQVMQRPKP